ncbi:MAG: hypothetical protein K2H87_01935 [Duncaniella sp.]|nr:hypothetical protein [Duncaniella sp.]
MVWHYTQQEPARVVTELHVGQRRRTINYLIEQLPEAETEATGYTHRCKSATLLPGVWNYDSIVDALVTAEYPRDKMDAVVNNYIADPADPEHLAEFNAMQSWRTKAKQLAKEVLD